MYFYFRTHLSLYTKHLFCKLLFPFLYRYIFKYFFKTRRFLYPFVFLFFFFWRTFFPYFSVEFIYNIYLLYFLKHGIVFFFLLATSFFLIYLLLNCVYVSYLLFSFQNKSQQTLQIIIGHVVAKSYENVKETSTMSCVNLENNFSNYSRINVTMGFINDN
jgi:hypothetical protein